jgi:hypothetical protein
VKALSDMLTMNNTLVELDLRSNRIGAQGGVALAQGLKRNTALISLSLWIFLFFFSNSSLQLHLLTCPADLQWNQIGLSGGRAFVEALKFNFTISYLELIGNDIPEEFLHLISKF